VALQLKKRGIENVRPLEGGLEGWRERGFPLQTVGSLEQEIQPPPQIAPE
jgi:3-mercaptopyruvate sulfurtransferase SseA